MIYEDEFEASFEKKRLTIKVTGYDTDDLVVTGERTDNGRNVKIYLRDPDDHLPFEGRPDVRDISNPEHRFYVPVGDELICDGCYFDGEDGDIGQYSAGWMRKSRKAELGETVQAWRENRNTSEIKAKMSI